MRDRDAHSAERPPVRAADRAREAPHRHVQVELEALGARDVQPELYARLGVHAVQTHDEFAVALLLLPILETGLNQIASGYGS